MIALIPTLTNRCHVSLLRSCERGARPSLSHKVGEVGLSLAHGAVHPGSGLTRPRLCPLYYGKCALSLENTASFIKPGVFLFTEGGRLTSQQPVVCDSVSRGRRVAGRGARLCTLLFRYATLPWMYLVSRIFSSSDVAFISYISLNFIFGLCTMLMTVMPRLLAIVSKAQVRDPLRGLPGVRGGREHRLTPRPFLFQMGFTADVLVSTVFTSRERQGLSLAEASVP